MTLSTFALLLVLMAAIAFWDSSRAASEAATVACKFVCNEAGVQLLDQTVAFRRFDFRRGKLRRVYSFDYSPDRKERFRGLIWMRGTALDYTALDQADGRLLLPPSE